MASNFAAAFAAEPTSESQTGSVLDHLTALVAPHAPPKQLKASVQPTCVDPVGGRHIHGTIDSGCTGHVTPNRHWLINHRPCADTFRAAAGTKHVATIIGDMPVMARDRLGGYHYKLITNVRCVESFAYTLFSVTQLWAELRVDSLFADTRCCRLVDGTEWPYLRDKLLPTHARVRGVAPDGASGLGRRARPSVRAGPGLHQVVPALLAACGGR